MIAVDSHSLLPDLWPQIRASFGKVKRFQHAEARDWAPPAPRGWLAAAAGSTTLPAVVALSGDARRRTVTATAASGLPGFGRGEARPSRLLRTLTL